MSSGEFMYRRDFLKVGLGATLTSAFGPNILARVGVKPRRIIIVGAGLAGLTAGYELQKQGHDVTILEAQSRPGGRVLTLRNFEGSQWADAGAARIPKGHDLTYRYVNEFGLDLARFYPNEGKFTRLRNGCPQAVDWRGFADATSAMMDIEEADDWRKIKGGNDALPYAFAERLSDNIRYNSPVKQVSSVGGGITATFVDKGFTQTAVADVVIVATPVKLLKDITFTPQLPAVKRKIIDRAPYDSASRVFLQTRERFWKKAGLNGFGFGPNSNEVWDASFGQQSAFGILESYTRFGQSLDLTKASEAARVTRTIKSLASLYPELKPDMVVKSAAKCWTEDPWARGAWARLGPLEIVALAKPEGPIFFAGEHLSFSPSWMQGAIASGRHVVDQISKLPSRIN